MPRNNKWKLLLSSLLILLPIPVGLLLWGQGTSTMPIAVFAPPLTFLAGQALCLWVIARDPGNKGRNRKPMDMLLWILPVLSNLCGVILYAQVLGLALSGQGIMVTALGLMFLVIGNYLPKCRQNHTMGIKVPWTFASEENWNATHRFAGRVWMIGGLVILLSAFLPGDAGILALISCVIALAVIPIVYSYLYYRRQIARGDTLTPLPNSKATKGALLVTAVLLVFVAAMLFTGSIQVRFGDTAFTVEASYYDDLTVNYADISDLEYREGNVDGTRTWGVGSFRLLLGFFQNQEFGAYTRYTYYNPEACVVLTVNGKTLVLSGKNAEATKAIYQQLWERVK